MVWLGRRSYGIYLFYWPVIMLTRAYYDVPLAGNALLALRAGITVTLAALSYRLVEAPIRNGALGRLWADVRRRRRALPRPRSGLGRRPGGRGRHGRGGRRHHPGRRPPGAGAAGLPRHPGGRGRAGAVAHGHHRRRHHHDHRRRADDLVARPPPRRRHPRLDLVDRATADDHRRDHGPAPGTGSPGWATRCCSRPRPSWSAGCPTPRSTPWSPASSRSCSAVARAMRDARPAGRGGDPPAGEQRPRDRLAVRRDHGRAAGRCGGWWSST